MPDTLTCSRCGHVHGVDTADQASRACTTCGTLHFRTPAGEWKQRDCAVTLCGQPALVHLIITRHGLTMVTDLCASHGDLTLAKLEKVLIREPDA